MENMHDGIEVLEHEMAPVKAKIVARLALLQKTGRLDIQMDEESRCEIQMQEELDEVVAELGLTKSRLIDESFVEASDPMEDFLSKNLVIMIFEGSLKFGVKFARPAGEIGVSDVANYMVFTTEDAWELMEMLTDDEYKVLCRYAAVCTQEVWNRYLNESTPGHLNCYHGGFYRTKGDLYEVMLSEARSLAANFDEETGAALRQRLPIRGV